MYKHQINNCLVKASKDRDNMIDLIFYLLIKYILNIVFVMIIYSIKLQ